MGASQAATEVGAVQQGWNAVSAGWLKQLRASAQFVSPPPHSCPSQAGGDKVPVSLALIRDLEGNISCHCVRVGSTLV